MAGKNFGCGSSREHAPLALKGCGVRCIIAKTFARIFFRNAVNIGLPVLECAEADEIADGDELDVDLEKGVIYNLTTNKEYATTPLPEFIMQIVE